MTDITVTTTSYQVEDRSWLIHQPGGSGYGFTIGGTLDISAFNAAHYTNGYIPSGTVVGALSSGGKWVPYLNAGSLGAETAVGILFNSVKIPNTADLTVDCGGVIVVAFAVVKEANLPFTSSTTQGGYIDATGRTDLPRIHFIA